MVAGGSPRPVVLKYYLYQLSDSVGFIWPIFTLFLLWKDLSYTQIGLLSAVSAVLVVAFEIPTGYVADRLGRRNALAIGMGTMAVSTAGFVVADTFVQFVALYVLWSLAMALHHGTDDAWLYATLKATADEASFTHIKGRGGAVYQFGSAVTMIAGGFLYVVQPTYPFVVSAVLNAFGVAVVLSMPQNSRFEEDGDPENSARKSLRVLRDQFTRPSVRTFVVYVALFFALVGTADTYIQPITVEVLDSASGFSALPSVVTGLEVPEEATLGFIYAGFALVAATASYHAETVRDRVGIRIALLAVPLGLSLLFLLPLALPILALPVFFLMKGVNALSKPLVSQYLNDRIAETGRATVLSAASMSYAVVRAPLKPLAGALADLTTPVTAVGTLGGAFFVVAIGLIAVTTPVSTESYPSQAEDGTGADD